MSRNENDDNTRPRRSSSNTTPPRRPVNSTNENGARRRPNPNRPDAAGRRRPSTSRPDSIERRRPSQEPPETNGPRYSNRNPKYDNAKKKQKTIVGIIVAILIILFIAIIYTVFIKSDDDTEPASSKNNKKTPATPTPTEEVVITNTPTPSPTPEITDVVNDFTTLNEDFITIDLLTPNPYSRPGTPVEKVNYIVIHYVGNPKTTAKNNRNYFEGLATTHQTSASSHFVVGLEGEVIQCVPLNEMSYASNKRNVDSINIEVCHPDTSGKYTDATYESLTHLVNILVNMYNLKEDQVIRHYDVTGKICPKYYVEHEDAWKKLKKDAFNYNK